MKVITYEGGRVTWLFPIEEFGRLGGTLAQTLVSAVAERYRFEQMPPSLLPEEMNKSGLKFVLGQFEFRGRTVHIGEFAVYNDGLAASSHSTELSEAFLVDVVAWLQNDFEFRQITTPIKKINLSSMVVEFECSLSAALNEQTRIAETLTSHLNSDKKAPRPAVLTRLDFQLDRSELERNDQPIRFVIEQRANSWPAQNRYYSSAPVSTSQHETALMEIESGLVAGSQ
jgi:hypothetical protein